MIFDSKVWYSRISVVNTDISIVEYRISLRKLCCNVISYTDTEFAMVNYSCRSCAAGSGVRRITWRRRPTSYSLLIHSYSNIFWYINSLWAGKRKDPFQTFRAGCSENLDMTAVYRNYSYQAYWGVWDILSSSVSFSDSLKRFLITRKNKVLSST